MSADFQWEVAPLKSRLLGVDAGRSPDLPDTPAGAGEWGVLKVSAVNSDGFRPDENKAVRAQALVDSRYEVYPGDLLFSRANTPELVGAACLVTDCPQRLMLSDKTLRLVLKPDLADARFVNLCLSSPAVRKQIGLASSGSSRSMQNISQRSLEQLIIRWPPLEVQRRIVAILGAVQERIDAEEVALRKQDSLWDGVLNDDLACHKATYGSSRLIDVAFRGGEYGSNSPAAPHRMDMPRYVRITDIDGRGFLSEADSAAASIPLSVAGRYLLAEGDLLIARTGYTTGKSYLYRTSDGLCAFAGYLVRFRINPSKMLPEYAFLWTCGNGFRRWVSQNVREVGQRNISAREYNEHEIAHPPLQVQQRFVDAAQVAREARRSQMMEIDRLHTLRRALAGDLLEGRVHPQQIG